MKVNQITTCDEGITNPKRSSFGVTLALRWGDVLHPLGQDGNWFKPPYFTEILRFWLSPIYSVAFLAAWSAGLWNWHAGLPLAGWIAYLLLLLLTPGLFITWNLFGWRGYLGAKVYGADAPEYKFWMPAEDVYDGSQAIQFSGRLSIND